MDDVVDGRGVQASSSIALTVEQALSALLAPPCLIQRMPLRAQSASSTCCAPPGGRRARLATISGGKRSSGSNNYAGWRRWSIGKATRVHPPRHWVASVAHKGACAWTTSLAEARSLLLLSPLRAVMVRPDSTS